MKNKEHVRILVFNCMTMTRVLAFLSCLLIGIGLFTKVDKIGEYKNYFSMEGKYGIMAAMILIMLIVIVVMSIIDSFQIGYECSEIMIGIVIIISSYIITGNAKEELEYSLYRFRGMGSSYHLLRIFSVVVLIAIILRLIFLIWYLALENDSNKNEGNKIKVICDSCGRNYESDRASCPYCGSKIIRGYMQEQSSVVQNTVVSDNTMDKTEQWFCPYCGTPNKSGTFCIKCGKQKP